MNTSTGYLPIPFVVISLITIVLACLPSQAFAQLKRADLVQELGEAKMRALRINFQPAVQEDPAIEVDSGSAAVLKTDPDLEAILEKAARFADDGNYRVAVQLWQAVLERSGDALYSDDSILYRSLADQVEKTLAGLPPAGLSAYRVQADANARAILASAGDGLDVVALNKVVRSYFLSSLGDDAAFRLGCLYLDRYDFTGALRMFGKVIDGYPDSDLPLEQLQLRMALCHSYLGDLPRAKSAISAAQQSLDQVTASSSAQLDALQDSLGQLELRSAAMASDPEVSMYLSRSNRWGVMPKLPEGYLDNDLVANWQYYVEPKNKYKRADAMGRTLVGKLAHNDSASDTLNRAEEKLIEAWRKKNWRPAGHLMFTEDRVFFKSAADITAWDREKIAVATTGSSDRSGPQDWVSWRSVWRNAFEIDLATRTMELMRRQYGGYRSGSRSSTPTLVEPASSMEVQLFGDKIYQQMSVCDGVVYAVEGKRYDDRVSFATRKVRAQYNTSIRRVRTNSLTAYDAVSGMLRWSLPIKDDLDEVNVDQARQAVRESPYLESGGFMAAPVAFQDLIIVPVNNGGAISVCALDPNDGGKTVWRSFLCDEPDTGAVAWSPVHLSVDGSDLFVNCGTGSVFVLDPVTGRVRFARRYQRRGQVDSRVRNMGGAKQRILFDGWSSDIVVPWRNQMVCFGSDTDEITALDRNTGDVIWNSEMNPIGFPVDYLLGVVDGVLYAAGPRTIIAYDLAGEGRMLWGADELFDGKQSRGRGMLTQDSIYIPVEGGIYRYSLAGNKGRAEVLDKVGVELGTDAPVGNLFSDGQRIWVHGASRLYALGK